MVNPPTCSHKPGFGGAEMNIYGLPICGKPAPWWVWYQPSSMMYCHLCSEHLITYIRTPEIKVLQICVSSEEDPWRHTDTKMVLANG